MGCGWSSWPRSATPQHCRMCWPRCSTSLRRPESALTESVAGALSGRRLLVVLDNCEHVLDAAADLVESILTRATTVKLLVTSREGLRLSAEHLWPVPSLDVRGGVSSPAVELFVERAEALLPGFELGEPVAAEAVTEICRRLDGLPLGIELAAARMVSMSPVEVLQRLTDRFRLLSGSPRGVERHQTLAHAVRWSYDLLGDDERAVLTRCSVFADGFDLAAATHMYESSDEFAVLDLLDSLVRKSLVTAEPSTEHTRYGMLETIRQFAEDQLAATGMLVQARDRHAAYFAEQTKSYSDLWDGPRQRIALDWAAVNFANLRTGYRRAADQADVVTAAAIAAHTVLLTGGLLRNEPVSWAEEILAAATAADIRQLPRLYSAAACCAVAGRTEAAVGYAQKALGFEMNPEYDPFPTAITRFREAAAYLFAGRIDRWLEISTGLTAQTGLSRVVGMSCLLYALPAVGRADEAMAMAEQALIGARKHGNPIWIALALCGYGRAFAEADPQRALTAFRQGLHHTRDQRLPNWEAIIARYAAGLEATHGEPEQALELFDSTLDMLDRAGNVANMAATLANLALFVDRVGRPDIAATVYGACSNYGIINTVVGLPDLVDRLCAKLADGAFEDCVTAGAAMELSDAVHYARRQIQLTRRQILGSTEAVGLPV